MALLAVAALSARMLAEAAAREGHRVIALDLFGDQDTRRAASGWLPIGQAQAMRIDAVRLLEVLDRLAREGAALGWIAGSGLEGDAGLLVEAAARLPLLGTAAPDVERVRDPRRFFAFLAAQGIAHPPVRFDPPADAAGWLVKDFAGCGGWHVRAAGPADQALGAQGYFQRLAAGVPMSATFLANGERSVVLGFNRQIVRSVVGHAYAFAGLIGPVAVPAAAASGLGRAANALAAEFALRGLGSIDFLLDGDEFALLEVNPRVPASLALYPDCGGTGSISAHLRASRESWLPPGAGAGVAPPPVRGLRIVYARRSLHLDESGARRLAAWPACHDLPQPGSMFAPGDPVCSLELQGHDEDELRTRLEAGCAELLETLESF